jgi:lipid II:glycine glycyltransferase (peptidoglycan interpeptide bridge formation enzyme)
LHSPDYGQWQEKAGVEVVYFTVKKAGKLIGCGLATKLLAPGGFYYFYCPYGPLLTRWDKDTTKAIQKFFKDNFGKKLLFVRLDCDLPVNIAEPAGPAVASTSALQPRTEWLLDITLPEGQLLANAHRKCRYHIRLSQKSGASTRIEKCNVGQLETFYELLNTTAQRDGFSLHSKEHYRAALESLGKSAFIGYADMDGKPVAASLCYIYDGQAHYIYGSSANEYRNLGIGYLLQWSCIQEA